MWVVVYIFFIILSLILLLNLLIAMLSFTFETVREESTLQCRTSFAQRLMRLELLAQSFNMKINVGGTRYAPTAQALAGGGCAACGAGVRRHVHTHTHTHTVTHTHTHTYTHTHARARARARIDMLHMLALRPPMRPLH